MNIPLKISKPLSIASSKLYISKFPFFIMWNPQMHKLKGYEIRNIINNLEPGDILLRSYNGYLNTYITPGFWSHAGLAISKDEVIHAVGKGVIKEDILDFCRTDSVAVLRFKEPSKEKIDKAIQMAEQMVTDKVGYDFQFADENKKVYCTELINECYDGAFRDCYSFVARTHILLPDPLQNSELLNTVLQYKH